MARHTAIVDVGLDRLREMMRGNFSLAWMDANPQGWGHSATPGPAGLGLVDIETGHYAQIPDHASSRASPAPRGCHVPAGIASSDLHDLNDRSVLWSDNVARLYDEAVSRQWNSLTDVPWDQLGELPTDLEKALCQMCTGLAQAELGAADLTAGWMSRISPGFHEVKLFLATQIMDEARHMEVFRKRALANGGGLLIASPCQQRLTSLIRHAPDYAAAGALMNVLAKGFSLALYHCGSFLAPGEVEETIFRLCMQDQARHLAYGVRHLEWFLGHHPERTEDIHAILDAGEQAIFELTLEPQTIEPRAILAGDGLQDIRAGLSQVAFVYARQVREYLRRLKVAGVDRQSRIRIPVELPLGRVGAERTQERMR
ncbi:MAG: ferritin-like domain-containing protein [Deltaproteobacteria bacterium]|nr:ferritin-like domain-containing protein [Deltaproteobacteria bacterium]